jgi:hypothetical protein
MLALEHPGEGLVHFVGKFSDFGRGRGCVGMIGGNRALLV